MAEDVSDEPPANYRSVIWIGSSRDDLRGFPEDVKDEVGAALSAVQWGRDHASIKTLKGFGGGGVREVRSDDPSGTYRVVFTAQFPEVIYVLHSFQKKSKSGSKTPKEEMERIERRLARAEEDHAERFG
jgi:phage-related protein